MQDMRFRLNSFECADWMTKSLIDRNVQNLQSQQTFSHVREERIPDSRFPDSCSLAFSNFRNDDEWNAISNKISCSLSLSLCYDFNGDFEKYYFREVES